MTMTISARRGSPRALALAGSFLAALTLAACGDDTDDTPTTTTTLETTQPTMQAAPPAMQATPPAMEAAPPAMAAAPTAGGAGTLAIADLVGGWATDLAACATASEVTTITLANVSGGGLTRTISSSAAGANGLDVVLVGTIDNAPVTETWTFAPAGTTPPLTSVTVAMGGEAAMTWVRCPAPTP